jgi:hypothetical protein
LLLGLGGSQGYVTYDDLMKAIPEAELNIEQLEDALAALIERGIEISDTELIEPVVAVMCGAARGEHIARKDRLPSGQERAGAETLRGLSRPNSAVRHRGRVRPRGSRLILWDAG